VHVIPVAPSVFLDANILYSRTLRDWICLMALDSGHTAYQVRWSEDVLAEWVYRMRRARPELSDRALGGLRRRLESAFEDAMVTEYNPADVPATPDIYDRHVLAAAASVPVDMLVTSDKRGIPAQLSRQVGVELWPPDDFLNLVADRHPTLVRRRMAHQIAYDRDRGLETRLEQSTRSDEELREAAIVRLSKAGAVTFAERLRDLTSPEEDFDAASTG
jgi:hypothetical protein